MATTEFNDASHYGFFMTGTTLTSSTGKYIRMSELVLAALRAQGVFDNMIDSTTPPATDKLWLDKNTDPGVLKEWDATGSAWAPMTFERLFGRAIVTPMATPTGTADALVVAEPDPFIPHRMYSLTPVADNTGAATIQVTGVSTFAVTYTDGSALDAQEFKNGRPTILLFTGVRFEVLFALADIYAIRDQVVAIAAQFPAIVANTMLVDNALGTARQTKTFAEVRDLLNVPTYVATRAELKALDTTKDTVAILTQDGREGIFIWKAGDYSADIAADTKEGIFIKADAVASTAGAWVRVYNDAMSDKWFDAAVDGATDDAAAINVGLAMSARLGVALYQSVGTSMYGSVINFPDGAKWVGNNYGSVVKKLSTYNGAALKTANFDSLTGTSDAFAAGVPERVYIDGIRFEGNYQNTARTAYTQASGDGLKFFCRKLHLRANVFNMQGIGAFIECPSGNGPTPLQPGFSREAEIVIYTHQTQYEGVVWKGPPDVHIGWILAADAGSRIVADQLNGKVSSPTYGAVNGGQTFCVVFDGKGGEVGDVHAFGNFAGGGIDWRGGGRINANLLMAESCNFGGINITGAASGIISKLDVHRTGGFSGDSTADFVYSGTGNNNYGLEIGVCALYRQDAANTGSRNGLEITGDFIDIGTLKVDLGSTSTAGHGLVIDNDSAQWVTIRGGEIARCKGTAPDGLASSGIYRKTTGNGSSVKIDCSVRDCDVAFRSTGTPRVERIDVQFFLGAGQLPFAGDARTQLGQEWNIRGVVDGVQKVSRFMGVTASFVANITTKQTLTVAHNLIYAPPFGKYHPTGLVDTPTSLTDGAVAFINATSADATNITIEFKMATANSSDSAPRVGFIAEI